MVTVEYGPCIIPGIRHLYEEIEVSTAQTLRIEIIWVVTVSNRAGSLGQGNRRLEELYSETLHDGAPHQILIDRSKQEE